MANPEYALSLKSYKNTVPCGGYKLTGGGQIGDSVIESSEFYGGGGIVLSSELLTKSEDNLYHDIKLSINTKANYNISAVLVAKELLDNNIDEFTQQVYSSMVAKGGRVLNYKDVYNIILHLFGLECDGIIRASDATREVYCALISDLLSSINFNQLLLRVAVNLNILTDEGIKPITLSDNEIAFYPNSIPTTGNYIYFGENGNVVHLDTLT